MKSLYKKLLTEYIPLAVTFIGIVICAIVFDGVIANTTYLISTVYSLYMTIRMAIKWVSLYKEQQSNKR